MDPTTFATTISTLTLSFFSFFTNFLSFAIEAATYVLLGVGFMAIAKNRKMDYPWLSFIPFARAYQIGKIADDIESKKGRRTNYGNFLLINSIVSIVVIVPVIILLFFMFIFTFGSLGSSYSEDYFASFFFGGVALFLLVVFVLIAYYTWISVIKWIAVFKIYKVYAPDKAVLFLVLSIIFPLAMAIIVMYIREKKDPSMDFNDDSSFQTQTAPTVAISNAPVLDQTPVAVDPINETIAKETTVEPTKNSTINPNENNQ